MTIVPVRLQLSRRKGFDLQKLSMQTNGQPAVNCARPGDLGNPFIVGRDGTRNDCVNLYTALLSGLRALTCTPTVEEQDRAFIAFRRSIKRYENYNRACWCPLTALCHVDAQLVFVRSGTPKAVIEFCKAHGLLGWNKVQ